MRYANIIENDMVNGQQVCVSLWTQGCPHRCLGCHNPETWDFNGGYEDTVDNIYEKISKAINKNGILRNLSILGGEPLCPENYFNVCYIIRQIKEEFPDIEIFVWTGYTLEELKYKYPFLDIFLLKYVDILIDGRFELDKRDITLKLRGSTNQRVLIRGKDY